MLTFEANGIQGVTGIIEKLTVGFSGNNENHANKR